MALATTKPYVGGDVSFRDRFRAWWEGYDNPHRREVPDLDEDVRPMRPAGTQPRRADPAFPLPWSPARLTIAQSLWGIGQTLPGGADYIADMAGAFSLSPADTALEIGSGLGGDAAAIVGRFGAYMTCYERDDTLMAVAQNRAVTLDIDDKVQFGKLTGDWPALRPNYFLGAVVRETLYTVEDKQRFLTAVIGALKPEGQLVITDLMFDPDADSPALDRWRETEPFAVHPCTIDAVTGCFTRSNVVTRTAADETDWYRSTILSGWNGMLMRLNGPFDRSFAPALVDEAELWARRIAAIDDGILHYVRLVGIKNG